MNNKEILQKYEKYCVYGLSPQSEKTSNRISKTMERFGKDIVGIYPNINKVDQIQIFQSLKDVPEDYRKFVNVFRKPEAIPSIVDECISVGGVEVLWLQLGITHSAAELKAKKAGIHVISNLCIYVEYLKFFG